MHFTLSRSFIALGLLPFAAGFARAEAPADSLEEARRQGSIVELEPLRVVGSAEQAEFLPGSAALIDGEIIRSQSYDNIDQVIRRVPGVYFRTEDGFGLFPNISFRGIGSMRTTSLTVMEDGVLAAPAPYASPAAYYTPTTGRMSGLEVLKGSSQIKYGPHTTGGVLNYLSTPVPAERSGYVRALAGENGELRFHAWGGDTVETQHGRFGFLLENYYRTTDGFKSIDAIGNQGGGDTGFTNNEPMLKLSWEPNTGAPQRLEFKLGFTDRDANETYLGLAEDDFNRNPYRRYSSSMFDRITTEQTRTYLRHIIAPTPDSRLVTTGYYNEFNRSWYKLNDVRLPGQAGWRNLSETLAGQHGANTLGVLRGTEDGDLRLRNNNREYVSYGIESSYSHTIPVGNTDHTIEVGLRLHEDSERRFQNDDIFQVIAGNRISLTQPGTPGGQDNRKGEAQAVAFYIQDTIQWDRFSLTPGARFEHIRYRTINDNGPVRVRENESLNVFAPGIGATYDLNQQVTFFGGAFRGFSVPSPTGVINDNLREETSIGVETGVRYNNRNGFRTEAVLFLTEFSDLIVPNNVGGTGTGNAENAGDARTYGLELSVAYDPGIANNWVFRNPNHLAFTYTDATIRSDAVAGGAGGAAVESIFAGARKGNRLPYVPEYQVSAGTGIEYGRWGAYLDGFFVPATYADASNTNQQVRPDGTLDARFGKNDSYFLLDLTVNYRFTDTAKAFVGVQNLLDEEYVASRLPHGPRPGAPRFAHLGMELTF